MVYLSQKSGLLIPYDIEVCHNGKIKAMILQQQQRNILRKIISTIKSNNISQLCRDNINSLFNDPVCWQCNGKHHITAPHTGSSSEKDTYVYIKSINTLNNGTVTPKHDLFSPVRKKYSKSEILRLGSNSMKLRPGTATLAKLENLGILNDTIDQYSHNVVSIPMSIFRRIWKQPKIRKLFFPKNIVHCSLGNRSDVNSAPPLPPPGGGRRWSRGGQGEGQAKK